MKNVSSLLFLVLLFLFLVSCGNDPTPTTDTDGIEAVEEIDALEEGIAAISEADADDPYLLSDGYFLGMKPGESLAEFKDVLREGELRTGEGSFPVFYIDGAEGTELGYVYAPEKNNGSIDQITITSPKVVTDKGARVGMTFNELSQHLGVMEVYASEIESRVYATKDDVTYRLATNGVAGRTSVEDIKGDVEVMQIILGF